MLPSSSLLMTQTTMYRNLNATTTGSIVKASPGRIENMILCNNSTTVPVYVKLYNKATAPTGADTPVQTILVNSLGTTVIDLGDPDQFSAGISLRASTAAADADATAPAANSCIVNIKYK